MSLPGYDDWKLASPDDDCCEFCGTSESDRRRCHGYQPDQCDGRCGLCWRDPDDERDRRRDEETAQ